MRSGGEFAPRVVWVCKNNRNMYMIMYTLLCFTCWVYIFNRLVCIVYILHVYTRHTYYIYHMSISSTEKIHMIMYLFHQSHLRWHFRKLEAQSLNISFATFQLKETFELWASSFETAFENVTPSGIGCTISYVLYSVPRAEFICWTVWFVEYVYYTYILHIYIIHTMYTLHIYTILYTTHICSYTCHMSVSSTEKIYMVMYTTHIYYTYTLYIPYIYYTYILLHILHIYTIIHTIWVYRVLTIKHIWSCIYIYIHYTYITHTIYILNIYTITYTTHEYYYIYHMSVLSTEKIHIIMPILYIAFRCGVSTARGLSMSNTPSKRLSAVPPASSGRTSGTTNASQKRLMNMKKRQEYVEYSRRSSAVPPASSASVLQWCVAVVCCSRVLRYCITLV